MQEETRKTITVDIGGERSSTSPTGLTSITIDIIASCTSTSTTSFEYFSFSRLFSSRI